MVCGIRRYCQRITTDFPVSYTHLTSTDEILYPASDTPDKINEAGQKAINAQSYTTEDGVDVELPAIEVIRELYFPASKDVSYIRLFYYPHGCTPVSYTHLRDFFKRCR